MIAWVVALFARWTASDAVAATGAIILGTWLVRHWIPLLPHYREYAGELLDLVRGEGQ